MTEETLRDSWVDGPERHDPQYEVHDDHECRGKYRGEAWIA